MTIDAPTPRTDWSWYDVRPWYDRCDWQSDPALAYLHGLQDGVELGRQAAERDLVAALAEALGGANCTDVRTAVRRHSRALRARAARAEADRPGPRPGDYRGARASEP